MRFCSVLLLILAAPTVPMRAQTLTRAELTLRGHVTDEGGAPLEGVEVTVTDLGRRARTDADGAFLLSDLPRGRYTVAFRRVGYAAEARQVDAGGVLDVAMRAVPFEIEPVTVTTARAPSVGVGSPLALSVLGPEALRREHGVSLAHTLEHVPGVRTLSTGEQIGKPVIRGLSGPRVLVLENGLRLEDYSWSDEDGPSVDARLADRVEIIRGPASVLYGSDAVGGVVNVVPQPLPDASAPGVRAGVEAYGASNNTEGGGLVRAEGVQGRIGWRGVVIGRVAEDYRTPSGKLENTGFLALNGELAGGTSGAWGSLQARIAHYGGEFRLLEASSLASGPRQEHGRCRPGRRPRAPPPGRPPPAARHVPGGRDAPGGEGAVPAPLARRRGARERTPARDAPGRGRFRTHPLDVLHRPARPSHLRHDRRGHGGGLRRGTAERFGDRQTRRTGGGRGLGRRLRARTDRSGPAPPARRRPLRRPRAHPRGRRHAGRRRGPRHLPRAHLGCGRRGAAAPHARPHGQRGPGLPGADVLRTLRQRPPHRRGALRNRPRHPRTGNEPQPRRRACACSTNASARCSTYSARRSTATSSSRPPTSSRAASPCTATCNPTRR